MKVRVYLKSGGAFDFTTDDTQANNAVNGLFMYAQDPKPPKRGKQLTHQVPHGSGGTTYVGMALDYDAIGAVVIIGE
jgi:hypothetical protein